MKSIIFAIVVTWILSVTDCALRSPLDMANIRKQCEEESNVSRDDIIKLSHMPEDTPVTEEIKCYNKCFCEKYGLINADGTIDVKVAKELFSQGNQDNFVVVAEAIPNCIQMNEGKTECSAFHSVIECITKKVNMHKRANKTNN